MPENRQTSSDQRAGFRRAFLHGAVAQSKTVCVGWGGSDCLNIGCNGDHYVACKLLLLACTRVACFSIHVADLSPHNILVALGFVRQAEAACKEQAKCRWRVQQWGLSIMYSLLWRWDEVVALPDAAAQLPKDKNATWSEFRSIAEKMGVQNFKVRARTSDAAWRRPAR